LAVQGISPRERTAALIEMGQRPGLLRLARSSSPAVVLEGSLRAKGVGQHHRFRSCVTTTVGGRCGGTADPLTTVRRLPGDAL
jgi:hypothetical protein